MREMQLQTPSPLWKDYQLIDSGNFEKLERFGSYILARPEPKALWDKGLSDKEWKSSAHTIFTAGAGFGKAGKEDSGTWSMLKKMPDQWVINYDGHGDTKELSFRLRLGLTSFKHVGVFPEQAPNWDYIYKEVRRIRSSCSYKVPRVLNLFAYTGAASVAARCAGAEVTHLDSVRQVVTWAKQNMELSNLDNIKWVVEDAMKFVKREEKRGNRYNGLILDPPAYGHGPSGEKWKLDECLFDLLKSCANIVEPEDRFVVLNLYSNGYSALLADTLLKSAFNIPAVGDTKSKIECGELYLKDVYGRALPLSVFARLRDE